MTVTPIRRDGHSTVWKSLPHNDETEASVLGGIMLDPKLLGALPNLEVDDFFSPKHRVVFGAMRALEHAEKPIDVVTLEVEIERAGRLEAIGGVAFLGELMVRVPAADNVLAYAAIVKRDAKNRRAIQTLASALDRAQRWPHDPDELVIETAGELQRIEADHTAAVSTKKQRWVPPLEAFLGDEEPDDDDAEDWIIRDLIPRGEPMLWGGPMKGGKTWAAMDLLISIALGEPWLGRFENTLGPAPCVGLFLEDNLRRIRKRLWELCRGRGITPNHPTLRANLRIGRAPLKLPDASHQRTLTAELKSFGAKFALVDNLTRVMVGDPNKTVDASHFTRAWMEVNEESGCAIGFLHHTRKAGGDGASADPFDTLRGSGDFGATARNIVVTNPIRTEDGNGFMAEVRMRGNLDLRSDSFVLGFERKQLLDRWQTKLIDRGEVGDVKRDVAKARKEEKQRSKAEEAAAEFNHRRQLALTICHRKGHVSAHDLATELGLKSSTSEAISIVFRSLEQEGVLRRAARRGYELVPEQGDLTV